MHGESFSSDKPADMNGDTRPWFLQLKGYHWFVFVVAALGWLFDTMDQQLFNLAREPAVRELIKDKAEGLEPNEFDGKVSEYSGYATSIFLIGWATGGIICGVLGDRIGRAKTMLLTIVLYSLFTGLSAIAQNYFQFALFRFLTGLGVGGEFAVGVSLVAESMPESARTGALGMLQALSAIGNVTAAIIAVFLGHLEESGTVGSAWRWMFVIGTGPALVALVVFRWLKEPERWQAVVQQSRAEGLLSRIWRGAIEPVVELFGDPRWRKNALVGVVLASSGVIGLWGIGFFAFDLNRTVFRNTFQREALATGEGKNDLVYVRYVLHQMKDGSYQPTKLTSNDLVDPTAKVLYQAALEARKTSHVKPPAVAATDVRTALDKQKKLSAELRTAAESLLVAEPPPPSEAQAASAAVNALAKEIRGRLTFWVGITSLMLNLGAFFGIYGFSVVAQITGRRPAFAVSFILAAISTAFTFWYIDGVSDVFWMIPIMGFCQLSLFGGYAIYLPELFPTRLRSTGTSFCYNVGRYVAATGPLTLGLLTGRVFQEYPEPMRYAGVSMCVVFLIGLLALPFAPETRGKPLPE